MKKLTAGIFATLLAVVSTGAANAEIASKGYVDDQVDTVEATVATKADKSALDTLSETVTGHTTQIAGKADKATTLAGYGITDGATKTELTEGLAGKVDNADITDMQVKANLTTNAEWSTEKSADDKYPSNAAVNEAITAATSGLASSGKITEIEGDITTIEGNITDIQGDVTQLQTDVSAKQNKNMGAGAANHIVTTDGTGNITSSATIEATKVTGLADVATSGAYSDLSGTPSLGTLASKSTITSADITDGTIAEADLNTTINASLDKADSALQKATADAAYAVKSTETTASTAASDAQKALTDIGTKSELTTTNKDNLVGAINELDAAMNDMATNDTIEGIQTDLTELEGKVNTNTTNIGTNTTHIGTVGNLSTTAKGDLVSAVNEVKTQADKGVSDAAAAQSTANTAKSTADSALTKANAAIPAPSDACADSANKCVLVSSGAGNYSWEVIARGDAE